MMNVLIKAGADVNQRSRRGGTQLIFAVDKGQTDVVRALLDANADPNIATKGKLTPLMKAAIGDHVEIITLLLAHCARTDPIDGYFKQNALKFAKSDAARSAIQAGTGPNCRK